MRFVPVGAVLLAAVVGGAMLIRHQARHVLPTRPAAVLAQRIIYHTAPGQTQRITLRDGSTVILGGATTLTVSLTAQRRTVDLDRGEAWFHVVHRNDWPFVVKAGGGTITDLGTAFVVDRESNRVEVTVTEGLVQVAVDHPVRAPRLSSERHRAIRLHRGERLTYGENAHSVVRAVNPRAALAWTTGELEFSQEPLSAVIENVDRYTRHPIAVSPAAGRLRLTTLVMSRRIHEWLEGLSRVLPVIVERRGARVCVRLRAAQTTYLNNKCGDP